MSINASLVNLLTALTVSIQSLPGVRPPGADFRVSYPTLSARGPAMESLGEKGRGGLGSGTDPCLCVSTMAGTQAHSETTSDWES